MQVIGKGLDWSWASIPINDIPRWGYRFFFRYLCYRTPSSAGKVLTLAELATLLDTGLDGWPNWEWYATRATEGRIAGLLDGHEAHNQLVALRWPSGRIVPVSVDTAADATNIVAVLAYLDGFQVNCPGYVVVPYGNDYVVNAWYVHCKRKGWQTIAWSGGRLSPYAFAFQNGNQAYNHGADENTIYDSSLSYRNGPVMPVPTPLPPLPVHNPSIGDAIMFTGYIHHYALAKKAGVYFVAADLSYKVHVTDTQSLAFLVSTKQYPNSGLTDTMVDSIPTRKA